MLKNTIKSTCSYCGVGCGILASKDGDGNLTVVGDPDHPVNKGMLCSKGRNLNYVVQDKSDRLLYPQSRLHRQHPLRRVSWDQAMNRTVAVFQSIIKRYGPDSVGFYVSGQCLTEEYYLINKLVKGFIGTNNIDTNSRLCMSSAVVAYTKMLGEDAVPISYEDIDYADCFLVSGANPAWCHPILWRRVEARKAAEPDTKIIVVDPRKTDSCAVADLHLQIIPGTDVILHHAIAKRLYDIGAVDVDFVKTHTEAGQNYYRILKEVNLKTAAKICGVSVADIKLAASWIKDANGFLTMWAMGLNQSKEGVEKNGSLINLHLLTGHIGTRGSGPFSLTGQPNAMGGREVGGMASLLAAHRVLSNVKHREEVAKFWGVDQISKNPGLSATEMFKALETGQLKAIWIICTNPAVSMPNSHQIERALQKAKFVVVQDISNRSETVTYADVVLPAAGWLEKTGTMTNSDRRVSIVQPLVAPPGEARPDADILIDFARSMGYQGFGFRNVAQVYDEYVRMTAGTNIDVTGLSHQRLKEEGTFQWPVPHRTHTGTKRLFTDHHFYTPSGRARFFSTSRQDVKRFIPPKEWPLVLTTGRMRDQWHTMTRTGKVARLRQHSNTPLLQIHPVTARAYDLVHNRLAIIRSPYGEVRVKVQYSLSIRPDVVFLPMHWGKTLASDLTRTNNLTDDQVDPYSKQPNLKLTYVSVAPYQKEQERVIVIGAGAAAYRFVHSYRSINSTDEITVISKEPEAFYNRVLLPEYVSEHLGWNDLRKISRQDVLKLNIDLKTKTTIVKIDREHQLIFDQEGQEYHYDKLLIATGSRPFIPRDVPIQKPGVFTLRYRKDADQLQHYLKTNGQGNLADKHVIIVGGGLLGLELAAALRSISVNITIVQRSNRLMERQLDSVASSLLAQEVDDRGIQTYFRNEVDTIFTQANDSLLVTFKSGKQIPCDAIVYAIGTRPNAEIGRKVGLKTASGIIVDDQLRTSDPNIYALGEVAEWRGQRFGITAAAEQQADILAHSLAGDASAVYTGSTLMNILKFDGFDLCSIGNIQYPKDDPEYQTIVFSDLGQRYYKKCIIHQDRLIGAILVGDKNEFAEFKRLIEDRIELSERRSEILRSGESPEPPIGRIICSCNNTGEGNIKQAIAAGVVEFNALCAETGAGLGCGSCKPQIQSILEQSSMVVYE